VTKSVPLPKLVKSNKSSKKQRIKDKSDSWKSKLNKLQQDKKELKAKKMRQKRPVIGDLKPLSDELTSILGSLMTKKINFNKPVEKPYNPFLSNVEKFQSVLQNEKFKSDPFSAVKQHILMSNQ